MDACRMVPLSPATWDPLKAPILCLLSMARSELNLDLFRSLGPWAREIEQEGLLSLSSHSLLYKQESGGGMVLASSPTDSSGAFGPGGKDQVEAGIWRESPGHGA